MSDSMLDLSPQLPNYGAREAVLAFERQLAECPKEPGNEPYVQITGDLSLNFVPGVCARTLFMPAGSYFTSKIHRTRHFFVVLLGSCTVSDSHGNIELIEAGHFGITEPGTKRILQIHEDCVWTTFHATDKIDIDAIEADIMSESFEAFDIERN